MLLTKLSALIVLLISQAWFLWSPTGWTFEWEPLAIGVPAFLTLIHLELNSRKSLTKSDTELITSLKELLSDNFIDFMSQHDFGAPFFPKDISALNQLIEIWNNANHSFQNKNLESKRKQLYTSATKLHNSICLYTSLNDRQLQTVKHKRMDDEAYARIQGEAGIINKNAESFIQEANEMIKLMNKKLG